MTDLAIIRAHKFGASEQRLARTLGRVFGRDAVVVCCDESWGNVQTGEWPKISLTLPRVEELILSSHRLTDWAWRMGDLCLYAAAEAYPHASRFVLVESDVFIPDPIAADAFAAILDADADLVACNLLDRGEHRYNNGLKGFCSHTTMGCIFALVAARKEAVQEALTLRRTTREAFARETLNRPEPNDEAVVTNAVAAAGMKLVDLYEACPHFFNPTDFWTNPPKLFEHLCETEETVRSVVHPALEYEHVLRRIREPNSESHWKNYKRRRLRLILPKLSEAQRDEVEAALASR